MQPNLTKVSVVIRAYNEEKLIAKTLQHIETQSYKNLEIILIDNNSTDKTVEIAKKFNVRIIHEAHQGHGYALNRGLKEAKGEIIAITDADSLPESDWIASIVDAMKDENIVGLTGLTKFDFKSKTLRLFLDNAFLFFIYVNFFLGKPHFTGFNMAVRKKYIEQLGDLNPAFQLSEDVNLGLLLKRYGKIKFAKKAIVLTSTRRWGKEAGKAFIKYFTAYLYTVWLRKPPPSKLIAIR